MRAILLVALALALGSVMAVTPAADARLPCDGPSAPCPIPDVCIPAQPCCHRWDACGPPPADP